MKDKLMEVLRIQSESENQFRMFAYIIRQLKKLDCDYYTFNGCIYATKGKAKVFPCVVSHMDTVHEICEDLSIITVGDKLTGFNRVTMSQTGIGGDDKVGIFIALQCLEKYHNIKAVFFRDEEIGCLGSYDPDTDFFSDCGFILQCDRKGNSDFISQASGVKLSGKDFHKDIKPFLSKYKYKLGHGLMTDVMALKQSGIECAMANISCGYYNPHSANEYIKISDVQNCLNLVCSIIETLKGQSYSCIYAAPDYKNYKSRVFDKWSEAWDGWDAIPGKIKGDELQICDCCRELDVLSYVSEYNMDLCKKCVRAYVTMYDA